MNTTMLLWQAITCMRTTSAVCAFLSVSPSRSRSPRLLELVPLPQPSDIQHHINPRRHGDILQPTHSMLEIVDHNSANVSRAAGG